MRILKHGNSTPRKFVCQVCGCEFVAERKEYSTLSAHNIVLWCRAECPECCNYTEISEPWEDKNDD